MGTMRSVYISRSATGGSKLWQMPVGSRDKLVQSTGPNALKAEFEGRSLVGPERPHNRVHWLRYALRNPETPREPIPLRSMSTGRLTDGHEHGYGRFRSNKD